MPSAPEPPPSSTGRSARPEEALVAAGDRALEPQHAEEPEQAGESDRDPGSGAVQLASGRVSAARPVVPLRRTLPFSIPQLAALDEALTLAERTTGLHFSIYLGDLGADTRARAEQLHASVGPRAPDAVLVAVSPGQRVLEIVTGTESNRRLTDTGCELAVKSMVTSFKKGDLTGGLTSGLRVLADHADHAGPV